jgi:MFS family permease
MSINVYKRNVLKIYIHSFFMMFLIIMPVLIPIFQSKGLSMQNIFELQAYFSLIVAVFEVPSGYFSDIIGRKITLIISSIFYGLAYTWLNFSNGLFDLYVFETLIAIAVSFFSGTNISLLYDSLNYIDDDRKTRTRAMGNIKFALVFSESIAALTCVAIVSYGLDKLVFYQACYAWIPFIVTLFLVEPPRQKMDSKTHFKNVKKILKYLFTEDKIVTLSLLNLIVWGLATYFAVWIHQKYWQIQEIDISKFGYLWALFNIVVAITSKYAHWFEEKVGTSLTLLMIPALSILGYFGMGAVGGYIGLALSISFQFSRGLNQVIVKDAFNWRLPSEFRATANSLHSLIFRLLFLLFGPLIGYLIDKYGVSTTMNWIGSTFAVLFVVFMLPLIKHLKSLKVK